MSIFEICKPSSFYCGKMSMPNFSFDKCRFFQVHKVIPGTLADRDGRIQKGDRVLSINGKATKGVTHREALSMLKVRNFFFTHIVSVENGL